MSSTADCPFCNLNGRVIKSNELANLFFSNPRKTEGHLLVTPKRHIEKPTDLTQAEILAIFELIFFAENKLLGRLGDGFDIRQHYRPFMPQSKVKIDHIHFHGIPRRDKDNIFKVSEVHDDELWQDLTKNESQKIIEFLK